MNELHRLFTFHERMVLIDSLWSRVSLCVGVIFSDDSEISVRASEDLDSVRSLLLRFLPNLSEDIDRRIEEIFESERERRCS